MKRIIILVCTVAFAWQSTNVRADEAAEKLIRATYKLVNDASTASGFVVHHDKDGQQRTFLLTAHHVLEQMQGESFLLVSRKLGDDQIYQRKEIRLPIRAMGNRMWTFDEANDVAALPLPNDLSLASVPVECLVDKQEFAKVRSGDEVIAAVFPERTEANNAGFPILRGGTIASFPLRPIQSHARFLVDVNAWKGDSGGPVAHRDLRYQDQWPLIVGVTHGMQSITDNVKESRFVERRTDYPLGISVVVHAAFARRLIEMQ